MSDQEDKSEEDKLTFYSLDNNLKQLQCGTQFNIKNVDTTIDPIIDPVDDFTIDSTVCYLKLTIDTVKHLSLFHLFLWQHRQGLLFQTGIQLIIIQNTLKKSSTDVQDPVINVSEYWQNLVSLSIQMGFSVYSYQQGEEIKQIKLNKRIEDEIILFEFKYQIIIVSQYSSIDTQSLPNCSSVKDQSTQQQKNESKEKTFPQFMPPSLSETEKQVILQKIGLSSHKLPVYAHLLPMILGYSAYLIYKEMLKSNSKVDGQSILISQQIYNNADMKVNYQKFFKINSQESQQVCNDEYILANFKNSFELPIHLLKVFEFDQNNKFIFQQMCDVSYMFKAQYFAIFSAFFKLDNAVLSQSSRSGKTVTLHTVFYFNLFSGLKIPILINISYQYTIEDSQPLYNRSSIQLGDNLKKIFSSPTKTSIDDIVIDNIKKGLVIQNYFSYLVSKINLFIQYFKQETQSKQIISLFTQYFNGETDFTKFQTISSVDLFTIINKDYVQADRELNQLINEDNEEEIVEEEENEEEIVEEEENEEEIVEEEENEEEIVEEEENEEEVLEEEENEEEVLVLVDECLNHQKNNYIKIVDKLVLYADQYAYKFIGQARSCVEHVLKILKRSIGTETIKKIQQWLDDKTVIDNNSDKSGIKKELTFKINQILGSDYVEKYFFKQLFYQDLIRSTNIPILVDFIAISSPNFIHVKTSTTVLKSFSEMMKDLQKYPNKDVFKQKLFHFLLMLHNPRGMETIFWRNIQYAMKLTSLPDRFKDNSINLKIREYFSDAPYTGGKFTKKLNSVFKIKFSIRQNKNYQEIPIIIHGKFNFLSAGTDLALINFIRQNQFIYTSESSRGKIKYIQSNILGTSQMHSSCLTQNYYRDMRITTQTNDSMILQIKEKVQDMSIRDFYLMMIPELAAELQFLCPLICPQIIINKEQNEYFFNSTQLFEYKVNKKEIFLNQISSHTQILNSLFILRSGQTVGAKQLVNDLVLLQNKSIAVFNTDLHLTSSSSLNRDVVFALNFLASQKFFVTLIELSGESNEASLSDLCSAGQIKGLFTQQQISEISSAILLVASLCRQHPTHIIGLNKFLKWINKYSQYLEIYVNPLQTQYNQQKTLALVYEQLQSLFQGAFTMFLQKSFDSYWNNGQPKMDVYVEDAVKNASVCFIKLQQLNLLKEDQKLVIVTILDKTKISNLFFDPAPSMPDYLISLFGVSDQEVQDFSCVEMLSIQPNQVEGQSVQSINLLMDSGTHDGQKMFEKQKDTGIATCFQVTKEYKQNSMQICLHHQVSPKYGAIIEKHEYYLAKQDEQKSSQEFAVKNNELIQAKQNLDKFYQEVEVKNHALQQAKQQTEKYKSVLTLAQVTLECQQAELKFNNADTNKITAQLYWRKTLVKQYQAIIDNIQAVKDNDNEQTIKRKQLSINNLQSQVIILKTDVDLADQQLTMKTIYLLMAQYKVTYVQKIASLDQQVVDKEITLEEAQQSKQQLKVQNQKNEALLNKQIKDVKLSEEQPKNPKLDKDGIDYNLKKVEQVEKIKDLEKSQQNVQLYISQLEKHILITKHNLDNAQQKLNIEEKQVIDAKQNIIPIEAEVNKALLLVEKLDKEAQTLKSIKQKATTESQKTNQAYQKASHQESLIDLAEKKINAQVTAKLLSNTLNEIKNNTEIQQEEQIKAEIGLEKKVDQKAINSYVDVWNFYILQQVVKNKKRSRKCLINQEDSVQSLINQLNIDVLVKLFQNQSYTQSSEQNMLLLSILPLLLEFENKFQQYQTKYDIYYQEDDSLDLMQKWLRDILEENEKIEFSKLVQYLQTMLKISKHVSLLVLTVLFKQAEQIVKQLQQNKQNQEQNTSQKMDIANDQEQQQPEEEEHQEQEEELQEQEEKEKAENFINKFFLLDNFYFTNYKRENSSSYYNVNAIVNDIESIIQIQSDIEIQKQSSEAQQQYLYQDGVYIIFTDVNEEALKFIFPTTKLKQEKECYYVRNHSNIENFLLEATIPINKIDKTKLIDNIYPSFLQFTNKLQFNQFGKFYLMSDSQCIQGGDIVWIANYCNTEIVKPQKFRNQFLFQILQKINTSLIDNVLTYKLLDSENTIKQTLENTDIIGFLLQNHLFPVSIDGNALIVDQLSDDNKQFKTTKSQQTIKSWFSNYCVKNRETLTPEVENYIKSFKPGNLTEEIAESANLELFDTEITVEKQIDQMILTAKQKAKTQFDYTKEEYDENEIFISIRKIGFIKTQFEIPINSDISTIMPYLKGFVIINCTYDAINHYQQLIFICIKLDE